jgi:hypothetical protein
VSELGGVAHRGRADGTAMAAAVSDGSSGAPAVLAREDESGKEKGGRRCQATPFNGVAEGGAGVLGRASAYIEKDGGGWPWCSGRWPALAHGQRARAGGSRRLNRFKNFKRFENVQIFPNFDRSKFDLPYSNNLE